MYSRTDIVRVLNNFEDSDHEEQIDVMGAIAKVGELNPREAALLWAVTQGWTLESLADIYGYSHPHVVFRDVVTILWGLLQGVNPMRTCVHAGCGADLPTWGSGSHAQKLCQPCWLEILLKTRARQSTMRELAEEYSISVAAISRMVFKLGKVF